MNASLRGYDEALVVETSGFPGWSEIFRIWLAASWIIVPVALLGGALAFALSLTMTPVYEAEAILVLDRADAGKLGNAADDPLLDAQQRAALVHSQIEILRGGDIVDSVVGTLHLAETPMFNMPPSLMSRLEASAKSFIGMTTASPAAVDPKARLDRIYLDHLSVYEEPDTYVLHVRFRAPDPALAERVTNAHVAGYLDWLKNQRKRAIDENQVWLATAVQSAHARVVAAEDAVQAFNRTGVLFNVEGRTALDQGLQQMTADLATAQAEAVKADAKAAEIRRLQKSGQEARIVAMTGSQDLQSLDAAYAQAIGAMAETNSNFSSRYPLVIEAKARANEIKAAINQKIDTIVEGELSAASIARDAVTHLTAALEQMKHQVIEAGSGRSKLSRLDGEAKTERDIYLTLLQKLDSYDKVGLLAKADATVLSPAMMPDVPRSPQRGMLTLMGVLAAGGAAAGMTVWRANARNVVRDTSDAINLTGVRCLGIMPELKLEERSGRIDRAQLDYSFFCEELRGICAVLAREHAGQQPKGVSVLVTSALPGEGKSTFCQELGRFAARSGVRTLIVHTDLPRPGAPPPASGAVLAALDDKIPLFGLEWSAPSAMFSSQGLGQQVDAWRCEYGLVIFDTPPLSAMAEGVVLAPLANATIVLARVDKTPRSLLASVTNQIGKAGGKLSGVVVTFAQLGKQRGVLPSDIAYYVRQNRTYHRRLAAARLEDGEAA